MDKRAIDQSKEEVQTPKTSATSSTVLSILKRFRSRNADVEDDLPSFDERLGAANGPLAERISEISSRIEAGRSQADETKKTESSSAESAEPMASDPDTEDAALSDAVEAVAAENSDARAKPRVRSMGFHNPVFPAKSPDEPKDPDFLASTEPPVLKLHDSSDGVMENSGAPEKRVTEPREKIPEPLDLKVFAEQVRAKLPKLEPSAPAENENDVNGAETEAAADAFKKQFLSRISKASKASAFESFPFHEEPNVLHIPSAGLSGSGLQDVTASSALQSWRQFQSAPDRTADTPPELMHEPVQSKKTELRADPVETASPETDASESHESDGSEALDTVVDHSSYEPHFDVGHYEEEREAIPAEVEDQETLAELAEALDPETTPDEEPEPETLTDFEPAPAEIEATPEQEPKEVSESDAEAPPQNVFAALDLDEEDILVKVYDLIQAELQAAWGENITLNIRKIVREEVRAALEKGRSDV